MFAEFNNFLEDGGFDVGQRDFCDIFVVRVFVHHRFYEFAHFCHHHWDLERISFLRDLKDSSSREKTTMEKRRNKKKNFGEKMQSERQ
mmetsp:Transcript_7155/g.10270  ORF Transcript_7155/g.10270 Transcript_7155/m.10270 type:complete len:88 (-) Transcript_7155:60-323(-)